MGSLATQLAVHGVTRVTPGLGHWAVGGGGGTDAQGTGADGRWARPVAQEGNIWLLASASTQASTAFPRGHCRACHTVTQPRAGACCVALRAWCPSPSGSFLQQSLSDTGRLRRSQGMITRPGGTLDCPHLKTDTVSWAGRAAAHTMSRFPRAVSPNLPCGPVSWEDTEPQRGREPARATRRGNGRTEPQSGAFSVWSLKLPFWPLWVSGRCSEPGLCSCSVSGSCRSCLTFCRGHPPWNKGFPYSTPLCLVDQCLLPPGSGRGCPRRGAPLQSCCWAQHWPGLFFLTMDTFQQSPAGSVSSESLGHIAVLEIKSTCGWTRPLGFKFKV